MHACAATVRAEIACCAVRHLTIRAVRVKPDRITDPLHRPAASVRSGPEHPARRPHRGRRLLALALAVAVPAMAAPSEWNKLPYFNEAQATTPSPMGFEIAGESFPGSAFYYLADEPYLPHDSFEPATASFQTIPAGTPSPGPAARSMVLGGSAIDKARALQCMTMAIYYEAASESDAGQRAVAQVVLNRVAHPTYPNSVCGVVFQGSERVTGCQFSFTCDGALARKPSRLFWERAQSVALAALSGAVYRPVGLATHYHTVQIHPYWADSLNHIGTIGAHRFYRWKGAAGLPAAFTSAYRGNEPLPARNQPTSASDTAFVPDPVELAKAYEKSLGNAQAQTPPVSQFRQASTGAAPATPAPVYATEIQARGGDALFSGNRLPGSGEIRSEYAASGQWIEQR